MTRRAASRRPSPLSRVRAGSRSRRLLVALVALLTVGAVGAGTALAYWVAVGRDPAASARADVITASLPGAPTTVTTPNPNSDAVAVTFPQAHTESGAPIGPNSYRVERYSSEGVEVVAAATCTAAAGTVTCTDFGVTDGRWQYTVTPVFGTQWLGTESARSATVLVDTAAPVVAVAYPASGTRYGPNWTGSITGTVTDSWDGAAAVEVQIQDTTEGQWWDGATWTGTQTWVTPTVAPGTPSSSWSSPLPVSALTDTHQYSVLARATDQLGNVGLSAATPFDVDIIDPLPIAIGYPVNTGIYGANWSGSITGIAGDPSGDLQSVVLTIEDITGSPQWWNGAGWQGTVATVVATSLTQWSRAMSAAALTDAHTYSVTATATDKVGNTGSDTHRFTYATSGVTTTVTYPTTARTYGTNWDGQLTGSAAGTGGLSVTQVDLTVKDVTADLYWTGDLWQPSPSSIPAIGTATWTVPFDAVELTNHHTYSVQATATDTGGNHPTSSVTSWTYIVDEPTVAVTSPTASIFGANWAGFLTGSAAAHPTVSPSPGSDLALAASPTVSLEDATTGLFYDGSGFASTSRVALGTTGTGSWAYTLANAKLTSGHTYSVDAEAVDTAGNVGTSPAVTFGYVTSAPSGAISYPVAATTYGTNWSGVLAGSSSATPPLLVDKVELALEDTTGTSVWWTGSTWSSSESWVTASGTTSWSYPLPASLTTQHTYALTARVTDVAGNVSPTTSVPWTYDTTPPTAAVTFPATTVTYGANWTGSVTGTATSTATGATIPAASTLVSVIDATTGLWWNGSSFTAASATWVSAAGPAGTPTTWSLPLAADRLSSDHNYVVTARATDTAGNISADSSPVTFQFDLDVPTAEVNYPTNGTTYGIGSWAGYIQGTASTDPHTTSTVRDATITIRDTTAGLWWNGSAWQGTAATVVATPPPGSHSWIGTYPFAASVLTTGHSYSVSAVVTDTASNAIATGTTTWSYVTTGASAVVTYPVTASVHGGDWLGQLSGTAAAASGLTVTDVSLAIKDTTLNQYWNGTAWQGGATSVSASGTTTWSYVFDLSHQSNNHSYSVVATAADSGGNAATPSATVTWTVDTSLPSVTVVYPATSTRYGPNWAGAISGTASDAGGNLSVVRLQVQDSTTGQWWNGTAWQGTASWVTATGTTSWSYPLALARLSDNHAYTVIANGTDAVGNVGTSATVAFTMDIAGSLPVAITYPVNTGVYGANWSGTIAGTSGDPSGDLSTVVLTVKDTTTNQYFTGSGWQSGSTTVTATNPSNWTYALSAAQLTSGHAYSVSALVSDAVGNTGTTTTTFSYLTSGVGTAITYPVTSTTYGASWNGSITGTASATSPQTVSRVNVSVKNTSGAGSWWNGTGWQSTATNVIATGTTTWSVPLGAIQLTNGTTYTVDATAVDNLANTVAATQVTFVYRSTAPTVAVTYPNAVSYGTNWTGAITGTAAAGTGLSLPGASTLAVQDATTGRWFTGSAFSATSQTWLSASGSTSWSYALASGLLTTGHTYTVVGRAVDNAGNTTTTGTTTFGFDTTAPTAAVTSPLNGAGYGANWSGVLSGSASAHTGLTVSRVDLTLRDTTAGLYWNGTTWQGTTATVRATGTGTWSYSLSALLTSQHAYSLSATTTDSVGNWGSSTVAWTFDTRGPTSTVTYPVNGSAYGPNWADAVSGTASAVAAGSTIPASATTVAIADVTQGTWFDGTAFVSPTQVWLPTSGSTSWTYPLANELMVSGNTYAVTARTTDSLTNQTTTAATSVVYDLTPPVATVTSPANAVTYGATWSGTLSGAAAGGGSLGVTDVSITVQDITGTTQWWNGSTWQGTATSVTATVASPGATSSLWSYALASARLTSGHTYTVTATATNQASSTGTGDPVAWGYSTAAPTGAIAYPVSGTVYGAGWTGFLGGTASPSTGLGIASVALTIRDTTSSTYWNGSAWVSGAVAVPASGTTSWTYPLTLGTLTSGHAYSVVATSTDTGGNTSSTSAATWTVDTAAPTAAVSYPVGGTVYGPNWSGTVSGIATDAGGALSVVRVTVQDTTAGQYWNGTAWQGTAASVVASGLGSWTVPLSVGRLTDAHHYSVTAAAVDTAGNTGTSSSASFVADLDSPLPVVVTYPVNNAVYGANWSGVLSGSASDASGNLSSVGLVVRDTTSGTYWNGSGWQSGSTSVAPSGLGTWTYALAVGQLTNGHGYSVTATATDALGNSGSTSTAFSYQTSGVTTSISYPVTGTTYGTNWSGTVTGTAAAPNGRTVVRVDVTVRNTTANTWWNGSSWQGSATSVQAVGTTTWSLAVAAGLLTDTSSYSVSAVATDDLSNTTSATAVTFTYRATAPSVAVSYPATGTYGTGWSGTVTGTAAAASGLALSGSTSLALQDTTTGLWFTGSAFTATSQTWLTGSGSTSWTYPLAAGNLTSSHVYSVVARATDTGGNSTTTVATSFTYFVATQLVILTQPTNTIANATMAPAVRVAVEDAAGHVATTDNASQLSLAFGSNPGSGTLTGGGTATVVGGIATYSGIAINKTGTGYTLVASASGGPTSATSNSFNIVLGAASKVAFTRQPSSSSLSGGVFSTQPIVAIQDAYGNTVTTSSAAVTLTSSGGTFACTASTVTAVSGVATFAGCKITGVGTFTLTAASSALTSATSTTITITGTQVGAPYNVASLVYGSTSGRTRVTFTRPSPTTGISSYTCAAYVNIGATSTPNKGALITSRSCTYSGTTVTVGSAYSGTNTIVMIVTANPSTGYLANSSAPVVGSVR